MGHKIPKSIVMFEVKNKTGLSEQEQAALVALFGYSLPRKPAWEQPYISAKTWHDKWGIDPFIMRSLYDRGLVERESVGNFEWNVRLTGRAVINIQRTTSWANKLGKGRSVKEL